MSEEFNVLLANGTWSLVPKQQQFNIICNKWVFHLKQNHDDSIAQYKACLVAKGFHQRPNIGYTKTYSPVIKPQTIKVVLCIALSNNLPLHQMDVNNEFHHSTISKDIYMAEPPGFCQLSLFRLCMQAPQNVVRSQTNTL